MQLSHLFRSVWKNHSLLRAYENDFVRGLELSGKGIDLGAKSTNAKYYEYMDLSRIRQLDFVDFFHAGNGVIQMDLEQPFPIADGTYDFAISFNVMEHIYNYESCLSETCRILANGGTIHGMVPLMWHFHPDPNDYFRFTGQAIEKMLRDCRMDNIQIKALACGPFKVAASQIGHVVKLRPLRFATYLIGIWMDSMLSNFSTGTENYSMAYYFTATKSGAPS